MRLRPEHRVMEYLALLAIFASPSPCYKLYAYDLDNIVSTKIFCLVNSRNYDSTTSIRKIEKRTLIHDITGFGDRGFNVNGSITKKVYDKPAKKLMSQGA